MSRIETIVVIDRPVEDVWLVLSDPLNLPTWCPEADDVTPLTEGPFSADTRVMVSGRIGPLRFRSTLQVIQLQPQRAIELRSVGGLIRSSLLARADLEPDAGRTRLTVTSGVGGPPGWLAVLSPGRQTDRDAFFASLKSSLESRPRPATASVEPTPLDRPSRAERDRRELDRSTAAEARLMEAPPSVAEEPVASIDRTGGYDAEERAREVEEPAKDAEKRPSDPEEHEKRPEQVNEAEQQVMHADEPTSDEDVLATVSEASPVNDPAVVTREENVEADRAPSPESETMVPAAKPPSAMPPAAADPERRGVAHEPVADDDRLMLWLETDRGPAATFEIPRSGATIGRAPENTVRLDDLSVSRRHARISYRQGGYWLSDLKSASGTWIDEKKLGAPRRLAADQIIRIGILKLRVLIGAAGAETPPTSERAPASPSAVAGGRRRR